MVENQKTTERLIGIISDTHNLLRSEAVALLKNVEMIIHAGDIGSPKIIEQLEKIAPVVAAVRGNNDKGLWADEIPIYRTIRIEKISIYVIHDLKELKIYPPPTTETNVIISGHSHKPLIREENKTLFVNPGSAGPRRFSLPVSLGLLKVSESEVKAEILKIQV